MILKLKRNDKIGLFFFLAFIISTSLIWLFEERFDSESWKRQPASRHKMVDDVIEQKLLKDKTKDEVIQLLGAPETTTSEGNRFIYELGVPMSFFKSKKEFLLIVFSNQKVVKVTIALE